MRYVVMACVFMAACTQGAVESVADENGPDLTSCNGQEWVPFVGQPAAQLEGKLPEKARVIAPDSAVTQDFRPDRVNVDVDDAGLITGIRCG